jgi:hypothetical protein
LAGTPLPSQSIASHDAELTVTKKDSFNVNYKQTLGSELLLICQPSGGLKGILLQKNVTTSDSKRL